MPRELSEPRNGDRSGGRRGLSYRTIAGNLAPARPFHASEKDRGRRMARFSFHVRNGSTFKDEVGESHTSVEDARAQATEIAGDLSRDRDYAGYAVVVTDEQGNEV